MARLIKDEKDPLSFSILAFLTRAFLDNYLHIQIKGLDNLPKDGPFICVANHSSRFDGPTLGRIINRPANFMVHPNELKGFQGWLLRKVGAFSSNPRNDFVSHILSRFVKGEPFVIFPEGNVFQDGSTHKFKKGVAKVAFAAYERGLNVPIVPVGIGYKLEGRKQARFNIGEPISVATYMDGYRKDKEEASNSLLVSLHREVLSLRNELGYALDGEQLLLTQTEKEPKKFLLPLGNQLLET
jgi:1-acyl-sn-glycerol-3-phosphate acyltransferase